jgi:hypothetical protein
MGFRRPANLKNFIATAGDPATLPGKAIWTEDIMATPDSPISVTAPLTPAWERVKTVLFRPFSLEKWLLIGFCAWLANLGGGGGGGGGGANFSTERGHVRNVRRTFEHARDWVMHNLHWLVPVAVGLALLGIILWLVFAWLSSRGRFMFLYCVAGNRGEVHIPWSQYAAHGNSLFLFRIVLGLIAFVLVAPLLSVGVWLIASAVSASHTNVPFVMGAAGLVLLALTLGLVFLVTGKLTTDFVVPIMFLSTPICLAGWRQFMDLLAAHVGHVLLYLLFQIVIKMVIAFCVLAAVLLTCCLGGCLLALPYVGTVFLLPVLVFERSYSLYYLAQFGPRYNVFLPESAA